MLTAAGFEKALAYWPMFLQGVVCTVALSALTVVFGFILALLLAVMRLSNIYPFRSLGLTKDGHLRDGGFLLWLSRFNPLRFVSTVYVELFRATYEIGRQHRVRVATSDGPEQVIILGHGALRLSASAFHEEMTEVRKQIGDAVWQNNQKNIKTGAVRAALEKAKEDGGC